MNGNDSPEKKDLQSNEKHQHKIELQQKTAQERNVKLEEKKEKLLNQLQLKKEKKNYILNTKLALKNEQINRKTSKTTIHQLNKTNENYKEKLTQVQTDLDNEIFKLGNTKTQIEQEVQQKQQIEFKVQEIEKEREKTTKDNQELQTILEDKQTDIKNAVDELTALNVKARKDYDLLLQQKQSIQAKIKEISELKVPKAMEDGPDYVNKAVEEFVRNTKHKENVRMKKYEEKKQKHLEKQQKRNELKQAKFALRQQQLSRKGTKTNVSVLDQSNDIYTNKLVQQEQQLNNKLIKLNRNNRLLENAVQIKENIEEEINRIEKERQQKQEDDTAVKEYLNNKKNTIQETLHKVNEINSKTSLEWSNLQEYKKKNAEERKQSELKLALLKKYA
tara:strand:- start:3706 stop:4875 length:1170 start_codon:yes stop_codon:yes gene_type:complete